MKEMKYLRLNIIDEYNSHMNQTDIADQLRGQYRPDAWLRNKKWWWSIFIWALGVAATNGYKIYCTMWDEDKKKGRTDLPKKWSHAEFLEQLVYDMIFPKQTILHRDMLLRNDDESSLSSFGGSGSLQEEDNREWDFTTQNGIDEFLDKETGKPVNSNKFARRFDGQFHATIRALPNSRCQYCYYQYKHQYDNNARRVYGFMEKNRTGTSRCLVCNVNLCPNCMNEWHGIDMRDTNRLLGK